MNFRIEQRIPAPQAAVEGTLLDSDFVAATADLPKLGAPELLENARDGDRAHQRIRYHFTAPLSGAVIRVVDPAKLTWVDDATYVTLEALGDSTRRLVTGELTVHVPLVGGRVERAIVDGLEEHANAEAELLGQWIAERR